MRHAILMTVHNNTSVVKKTIQLLDNENFNIYILVDKKSKYQIDDFIPKGLENTCIYELDRIKINWGGYSSIEAEIALIERALEDSPDYLHYLQGADLPLKTAEEINFFFSGNSREIYIDINDSGNAQANYRVNCKHYFIENSHYRTNKLIKFIDHGIAHLLKVFVKTKCVEEQLYLGSALWSIPKGFAEYIVSLKEDIRKKYKYSATADEVFMQTIAMNSIYKENISPHGNLRLVDWKNGNNNSPKVFTMLDKKEILEAMKEPCCLFARKFSEDGDFEIVKYIENYLLNKQE